MNVTDRKPVEYLSHWHHSFSGLNVTPKSFYNELSNRIRDHEFPSLKMDTVEFPEGSFLSAKRRYLRVMRGELAFDICGAPFGNRVFFVSSWLGRIGTSGCGMMALGCLAVIPGIGLLAERQLRPLTCYEVDTAYAFQEAIQSILVAHLDELCGSSNITPLTAAERAVSNKRLGVI